MCDTCFRRCHKKPPIVKLAKIWTRSNNEAHIERQSVFQLETLCNYALDIVEFGKRFYIYIFFYINS